MQRQKLKTKDIDLLEVYKKGNEVKVYSPWLLYATPPLIVVLVLGCAYGFLGYRNYQINNEISEVSAEIKQLQEEIKNDPNVKIYDEIQVQKESTKKYERLYEKLASYPVLQTGTFQAIQYSAYGDIEVTSLSYARESQIITVGIETRSANGTETFVRRLKDTNTFSDVVYTGYLKVDKTTVNDATQPATELTTQQILDLINNTKSETTKTENTYEVYTATVLCTLK